MELSYAENVVRKTQVGLLVALTAAEMWWGGLLQTTKEGQQDEGIFALKKSQEAMAEAADILAFYIGLIEVGLIPKQMDVIGYYKQLHRGLLKIGERLGTIQVSQNFFTTVATTLRIFLQDESKETLRLLQALCLVLNEEPNQPVAQPHVEPQPVAIPLTPPIAPRIQMLPVATPATMEIITQQPTTVRQPCIPISTLVAPITQPIATAQAPAPAAAPTATFNPFNPEER